MGKIFSKSLRSENDIFSREDNFYDFITVANCPICEQRKNYNNLTYNDNLDVDICSNCESEYAEFLLKSFKRSSRSKST